LLNIIGIKQSSIFNELLVALGITVQSIVLVVTLGFSFNWSQFVQEISTHGVAAMIPGTDYFLNTSIPLQNFVFAVTLAMSSFIGIESIAQAAEETKKPYRWIPRANKLSILFVLVFTIGLSAGGIGGIGANGLTANITNPVTAMAQAIPNIGIFLAPIVAATGFLLCYVSTNTGVIGVSRVVFSMGRYRLLPRWFYRVHRVFRTPVRAILIFGILGAVLALPGELELVANLYNFGALLSYIMVNVSLIILRNTEPDTYRAWKVPGEIRLPWKGRRLVLPWVSVIGTVFCVSIWLLIIAFHQEGRVLGAIWLLVGITGFFIYRRWSRLPVLSKEGGREIKPSGYVMNALVLVRTPEDPRSVLEALRRALDPRFNLTLFNVIDPSVARPGPGEMGHYDYVRKLEEAEREDLEDIAKMLRNASFRCQVRVAVGPLIEVLREEAESEVNDAVVLIKRKTVKGDLEKERIDSAYAILSKYPGKLMVVRRLEVRGKRQ
jgi:APA family basic amino acid/polyamine antiporter